MHCKFAGCPHCELLSIIGPYSSSLVCPRPLIGQEFKPRSDYFYFYILLISPSNREPATLNLSMAGDSRTVGRLLQDYGPSPLGLWAVSSRTMGRLL